MTSWHTYPSIYNLGHRAVRDILTVPHYVEEKLDGSQFSFGIFPIDDPSNTYCVINIGGVDYEFKVRSKGAIMNPDAPEKMFSKAVSSVRERIHLLTPSYTYRTEYLAKPSHNSLHYNRVPEGFLMLFDVNSGDQEFLSPNDKKEEADRLGLECMPIIAVDYLGKITNYDVIRSYLNEESILGGQKIEGVVIKQLGEHNPNNEFRLSDYLYGQDKKVLMGKFVSEAFKEVHSKAWKENNPSSTDIVQKLIDGLATPARWQKAVQHLKEKGELEDSPRDIGKLIIEAQADILKEEEEMIKAVVWKHIKPQIIRGTTKGLPEWYKNELLKKQFEEGEILND